VKEKLVAPVPLASRKKILAFGMTGGRPCDTLVLREGEERAGEPLESGRPGSFDREGGGELHHRFLIHKDIKKKGSPKKKVALACAIGIKGQTLAYIVLEQNRESKDSRGNVHSRSHRGKEQS